MNRETFTCPFTGADFEGLESSDGNVIVQNPLTGETMRMTYDVVTDTYSIDRKHFAFLETMSSIEAADYLDVSRARISKMAIDDVVPHFTVNGKTMFLKSDIIKYAETRSIGRPAKAV